MILSLVFASLFGFVPDLGKARPGDKFFYHHPPDPVNVRTLNFFFPIEDHLVLPCVYPIEIKTAYNSYSGNSSLFGQKWTFNHNTKVNKGFDRFEVVEGDGFVNVYQKERNLEEAKNALVEKIIIAQKKIDSQGGGLRSSQAYDELKRKLASDESYRDEQGNKLLKGSVTLLPGTYYSFSRGPSNLEFKTDGSFVRKFQNGSVEYFDKDGHIVRSEDRNANFMTYVYQAGGLTRINDMCGRSVTFFYQSDPALKGLVQRIEDSLGRKIVYEFSPSKRLKSFVDTTEKKMEFEYDKAGNMIRVKSTKKAQPTETVEIEYNPKFEVQVQKGPGNKVTKYKRTFVANDPNHSITEITKLENDKVTGREVQEFKARDFEDVRKYDSEGKEASRETKTLSKETGYPTTILDAKGNGDKFQYDGKSGNLMRRESVPGGEVMNFQYEDRCRQIKSMKVMKKDGTAASPNNEKVASEMSFTFDERCNLLEVVEMVGPTKKTWITLDYLKNGKLTFIRERTGTREIAFTYWQYGKPDSITLKDVGTLRVLYSNLGEIEKVDTFPHGKGEIRFKDKPKADFQGVILMEVRTALDQLLQYLRPAGLNIGL